MQTTRACSARLIGKAGVPGGTPVGEFPLVRFGRVEVDRPLSGGDFTFTRAHALAAVQWFDRQGCKLVIDFEHQTLNQFNRRPDGLAPAAGWIGKLQVRGDGLWATDVKWTDQARTLIATGQYRYPSPVIYWSDEQYSELTGLGPVGLTNDPALTDLPALAVARCGLDSARFCRLMPDHPICTTRTGESNMPLSTVFQSNPQLANGASESAGSAIAAIVGALREALSELMGELDNADAATRGAIAHELTNEDYDLFDMVGNALLDLREMTATAAGSRGGIPSPGGASLSKRGGRFVAAKNADRSSIIVAAKRSYAKEEARTTVMCDQIAWVNLALRDAGRSLLTEGEAARHGLGALKSGTATVAT